MLIESAEIIARDAVLDRRIDFIAGRDTAEGY